MPKISLMCASVTLRVRWPTCRRVGPSSPAAAAAAGAEGAEGAADLLFSLSSVSMGLGLSLPPLARRLSSAGRAASAERRRPRGEGLRERPLLLVPLLEVPLELEEPLEREELPLLDEEPELLDAGMAALFSAGAPAGQPSGVWGAGRQR